MSEELKPCPFCGSKATVHSWWSDIEECGVASIGCSRESYSSGYECARIHVMRVDEKTALEDAVRIWNTRTPKQAIAATLGRRKAKAHPYGYEPDTGAFDVTRCECGCLNDISATYCNDCGGEIEVDMDAEKEIYNVPRHSVVAEKHDDGSLEFGGKRYVAATLGSPTLNANLEQALSFMRIWISDDAHIGESELSAAFEKAEGLRKLDAIESAIAATLGGGECEPTEEYACSVCGQDLVACDVSVGPNGGAIELDPPILFNFCPNCGKRIRKAVER